jgi:hypothetical protein
MGRQAMTPKDRVSICDGVSSRTFDSESVVLDLCKGRYFGLNEVGDAIWQELSAGKSLEQIAKSLAARYGVAESILLEDILLFVNELVDGGLVRIKE